MPVDEVRVMRFVEEELASDPTLESSEIYEKAKSVDPRVSELSLRQFNARFPLQVKRRQALDQTGSRGNGRRARAGRAQREVAQMRVQNSVRETFLRFAADLSSAGDSSDLVRVIAGVDDYVDSVMEATR